MYQILISRYKTNFEKQVNKLLDEGWSLHGRLIIDHDGDYVQAMYKPKPKSRGAFEYGGLL